MNPYYDRDEEPSSSELEELEDKLKDLAKEIKDAQEEFRYTYDEYESAVAEYNHQMNLARDIRTTSGPDDEGYEYPMYTKNDFLNK